MLSISFISAGIIHDGIDRHEQRIIQQSWHIVRSGRGDLDASLCVLLPIATMSSDE
ncbi:MAG: hypothetical protein ACLQBD_30165 [Syntrophobacteraceae bacterium]